MDQKSLLVAERKAVNEEEPVDHSPLKGEK